tara:strand:- start:141 stop:254 length:114 start_codon:yes stop_codon:yes gene_type:complete
MEKAVEKYLFVPANRYFSTAFSGRKKSEKLFSRDDRI